jgi:hypothetical protein
MKIAAGPSSLKRPTGETQWFYFQKSNYFCNTQIKDVIIGFIHVHINADDNS